MFKVFSVPGDRRGRADEVLRDDLVSRQSIALREGDTLGFPGLGTLVLVEGDGAAVSRAATLFQGIGEELPEGKASEVRRRIRDQEDDVAAGVGMIFG